MNMLTNVLLRKINCHIGASGSLVAFEGEKDFSIDIKRVFTIKSSANVKRGMHAHKELTQVLVCLNGCCVVVCDDGFEKNEYKLDQPNHALVIPGGIWSEQLYVEDNTILMVLCDMPYHESDYIRDYSNYLKFRGINFNGLQ